MVVYLKSLNGCLPLQGSKAGKAVWICQGHVLSLLGGRRGLLSGGLYFASSGGSTLLKG